MEGVSGEGWGRQVDEWYSLQRNCHYTARVLIPSPYSWNSNTKKRAAYLHTLTMRGKGSKWWGLREAGRRVIFPPKEFQLYKYFCTACVLTPFSLTCVKQNVDLVYLQGRPEQRSPALLRTCPGMAFFGLLYISCTPYALLQCKLYSCLSLTNYALSRGKWSLGTTDFDKISKIRCMAENFGRQWKSKICL